MVGGRHSSLFIFFLLPLSLRVEKKKKDEEEVWRRVLNLLDHWGVGVETDTLLDKEWQHLAHGIRRASCFLQFVFNNNSLLLIIIINNSVCLSYVVMIWEGETRTTVAHCTEKGGKEGIQPLHQIIHIPLIIPHTIFCGDCDIHGTDIEHPKRGVQGGHWYM